LISDGYVAERNLINLSVVLGIEIRSCKLMIMRCRKKFDKHILAFVVVVFTAFIGVGCASSARHEVTMKPTTVAFCPVTPNIDRESRILVVMGELEGKPVRVLIDTGASMAGVSPSLAENLKTVPGQRVKYAGAAGVFKESAVYSVSGLRLGGARLGPLHACTMKVFEEAPADLLIGRKQLSRYVVDIDLRSNVFCLHARDFDPGIRMNDMVYGVVNGNQEDILVTARIGTSEVRNMIWDTCAGVSTINETLLAGIPHTRLPDEVISVDGAGVRVQEYFVSVPRICVFGVCKDNQKLMPGEDLSQLVGYKVNGIIGLPFMRGSRILMDFPREKIAIMD
jgi:hypothetical protein